MGWKISCKGKVPIESGRHRYHFLAYTTHTTEEKYLFKPGKCEAVYLLFPLALSTTSPLHQQALNWPALLLL